MKNLLMSIGDKILLRKRALIETVNDKLKNIAQIEYLKRRYRSYYFLRKTANDLNYVNDGQLSIF